MAEHSGKKRVDESKTLTLDGIRNSLIRKEDSIIFSLLERAQYSYNADAFFTDGFNGSLVEFMVLQTENLHAQDILPRLVKAGDDDNCGSVTVCDTLCLQALSKRIHYGKFVAEAKFRDALSEYEAAYLIHDRKLLLVLLTYETVEELVKKRVEIKARTYGQVRKVGSQSRFEQCAHQRTLSFYPLPAQLDI
ncbi:hypothetical protein JHK85_003986 [Glycine max]|nr:hypothetical protein JHK85_003986 [Glycine max]KAG5079750.1 hypothetical protein JHK86_003815 [Glycine max]